MNNLIVKENNLEIKDNVINIELNTNTLNLTIKGKVLINEINKINDEELNLTINMTPNSSLIYNRFIINNKTNNKIILNQDNNSNLTFNYSILANNECNIELNSYLNGNNNNTDINVKCVTEQKGTCYIKTEAKVIPNIKENDLLESIKVLNLNGSNNTIMPNLLVSSNEVTVNHAATISNINPDYLFYLNSKGISNENAIELIKNGYLISNLSITKEEKEKIDKLLGGQNE
ncbi:MAG: SufD family Fe-S cluster assembly protein [Bacilli bacterium]|nr:SufD family Fe-S cluster assembly protein [Bacilli bacterium]